MKSLFNIVAVLLTSTTLMVAGMGAAEAKRFGGGKSFGGKFGYSQSLKKNSANKNGAQRQQSSPAQQQNAARKQQLAQRGGLMGMFGALAMGGLLGALFFGGAFEGVNFMDLLIFGLIIFLLFKFMARRSQPAALGGYGADMNPDDTYQRYDAAAETGSGKTDEEDTPSVAELRQGAPRNFDEKAFIDGAKSCFARLQRAWDEGDLADIRQFTTDHVFSEIQDQYRASGSQNRTDIVSLNAELLSASNLGAKEEAIVLFRGELKEDAQQQPVEEVWHFVRPANNRQTTWFLDGIQQVEG